MAIQFRKATIFDAPAIAKIFEPEVLNRHFRGFGDKPAVKVFNSMIAHESITIDADLGLINVPVSAWVATERNDVVGFFVNKPWIDCEAVQEKAASGESFAATPNVELWMLAVRADVRSKGVGRTCLEKQIAHAKRLARNKGALYARCYLTSTRAIILLKLNKFNEYKSNEDGMVLRLG